MVLGWCLGAVKVLVLGSQRAPFSSRLLVSHYAYSKVGSYITICI